MIKHIILWTLKEEYSPEEKKEIKKGIKEGLEGLMGQIPGLMVIKVNIDGLESSNADLMLDSTFKDESSLKAYAVHPKHVEVADTKVRPYTQVRSCLDFEVEEEKKQEYWDIYDKDKKRTGYCMRRNDWILKDDEYHLSVLGVIRRPDGKFLITQRVMTKSWAPGWWEVSGGAAMAGEDSFEAVCREVKEEVGLDVSNAPCKLAYTYHRENPGEGDNYFVDVYRFDFDFDESDVKIQEEEALGFKIATLDEIKALAAEGIFLHYDSIKSVFED